jgi:hypothetical protein
VFRDKQNIVQPSSPGHWLQAKSITGSRVAGWLSRPAADGSPGPWWKEGDLGAVTDQAARRAEGTACRPRQVLRGSGTVAPADYRRVTKRAAVGYGGPSLVAKQTALSEAQW